MPGALKLMEPLKMEYLDFQVGIAGNPQFSDMGGASIERCAAFVSGRPNDFDIRRSAEWGGEVVASVRSGQLVIH